MIFNHYAEFYDQIYKKKPYKRECDYLEELFKKYMPDKPKTILDLGCGTGNHMIQFCQRGYVVFGVDRSSPMLNWAREKLGRLNLKAQLFAENLETFHLNKKIDAVLCLFSVLNYITKEDQLMKVLQNVRDHMHRRSLFIFDFWHAPAVENYYSPQKSRVLIFDGKKLERKSTTKIYQKKQSCEVTYICDIKKNGLLLKRITERHILKYFTIPQIESFLDKAGLKVLNLHPFMNRNGKVRRNTWDITIVAKKNSMR